MIYTYLIIFIVLFICELFYFRLADKFNIIDKPNKRSSHNYITIRGGGIVFWLAGVIYAVFNFPASLYFLIGLTLICGVSFWDDIASLSNKIRIMIHFLSISFIFYGLNLYAILPWYLVFVAYIFFAGILNAYNFMDGINGITGLYSLSILLGLLYINCEIIEFANPDLIYYPIFACFVFLFFNFRTRAKCFAGDVGSMGLSFWIVTLLAQLCIKSDSVVWVLFLTVYGVDSICTILHRLLRRQNIFKAHRFHFYQILSNECGISHLKISAYYACLQIIINVIIIYFHISNKEILTIIGGCITGVLTLIYCIVKPKLLMRFALKHS